MIGYRDFTVDPIRFNGTYQYFEQLQKDGMKLVLILVLKKPSKISFKSNKAIRAILQSEILDESKTISMKKKMLFVENSFIYKW